MAARQLAQRAGTTSGRSADPARDPARSRLRERGLPFEQLAHRDLRLRPRLRTFRSRDPDGARDRDSPRPGRRTSVRLDAPAASARALSPPREVSRSPGSSARRPAGTDRPPPDETVRRSGDSPRPGPTPTRLAALPTERGIRRRPGRRHAGRAARERPVRERPDRGDLGSRRRVRRERPGPARKQPAPRTDRSAADRQAARRLGPTARPGADGRQLPPVLHPDRGRGRYAPTVRCRSSILATA